ncbi:uncharacterized protein BDW43DRAFT_293291 [Aspergillus alliaceus]|uniref:uncharacterized protein n=1 Tax=Petromyces alliaceus TaxID=209559 RepID=UPI0012A4618C|nr:uncharacterized protein BDW43DRAFT_293291 [Aspergillus alliaceus]KAB8227748.1 hypothetical protein BDW43DRAFT_293291 [Aspergillus alliaceus]
MEVWLKQQQQQSADTQVPPQGVNHSLPDDCGETACTSNQSPKVPKTTSSVPGIDSSHEIHQANKLRTSQAASKLPDRDVDPVGFAGSAGTVQSLFDDPLFDSEAVLRELDAAFASRKRTGDEAFPELGLWGPPEKRRLVESEQDHRAPSPSETPSLSSPDSSHQPEQGGTAPQTPGVERLPSPNPLFDSLDALFEDPDFNVPLIPDDELPPDFELEPPLVQDDQSNHTPPNQISADSTDNVQRSFVLPDGPISREPPVSEITKQRFSLDSHDIVSNTSREILQRIHQDPEYTSPYPAYGGPLGYLPSAPGIHVKCIEVAEDRMNYRLSNLKDRVYQLTCERNKYKNAWFQWTTIDPATGKTKEQLLREENSMLRRVSSQHQNRVEQYKREATEWKNRLHELGTIYNNLLYDIHVQRQLPAVAPIPDSYKPPRTSQAPRGRSHTPNSHAATPVPSGNTQPPNQGSQPLPSQCSGAYEGQPPAESQLALGQGPAETRPTTVTIDLTDETESQSAHSEPLQAEQRRMELLQSLRNKRYDWLQGEQSEHGFHTTSASQSPLPQHGPAPLTERSRSNPPGRTIAHHNSIDDELARMMEEELAEA